MKGMYQRHSSRWCGAVLEWNTKRNGLCCQEHYGHKEDYSSINQVERITGVDFFPPLPDDMEEIKSKPDLDQWR